MLLRKSPFLLIVLQRNPYCCEVAGINRLRTVQPQFLKGVCCRLHMALLLEFFVARGDAAAIFSCACRSTSTLYKVLLVPGTHVPGTTIGCSSGCRKASLLVDVQGGGW